MKLIGITGKKRSGKDTCADYLLTLDKGHKRAFADLLKIVLTRNWDTSYGDYLCYADFDGTGIDREMVLNISNYQAYNYLKNCVEYLEKNYNFKPFNVNINDINISEWTIRKFLQTLGTDIVVNSDKAFWVKHVVSDFVNSIISNKDNLFIVTDCRQTHEIETIRKLGGTVIHIKRNTDSSDSHITEQDLYIDDKDIVIHNDSSLEDFLNKVKHEYETIRCK